MAAAQKKPPTPAHNSKALEVLWSERLEALRHAFQPIIHLNSGTTYGVEALMRGVEDAGFDSIAHCVDTARADGMERYVDLGMRAKALETFAKIPGAETLKLFCNVDNHIYEDGARLVEQSLDQLVSLGLPPSALCVEVSEQSDSSLFDGFEHVVADHRAAGLRVAIDDFGAGFAGLSLLFHSQPDFVKIDKLFITNIAHDLRKRIFVSNIINLARNLGIAVIAEGIETSADLKICQDMGCDFGQGYFISRPQLDIGEIKLRYDVAPDASSSDQKAGAKDALLKYVKKLLPVRHDASVDDVIKGFDTEQSESVIPIVDDRGDAIGIVRETDLRSMLYNPYGRALLQNKGLPSQVRFFVRQCPMVDLSIDKANVIENYVAAEGNEGLLVCDGRRYIGFLTSQALLAMAAERRLAVARDQNPLSQLPGNTLIRQTLEQACEHRDQTHTLAYFDFDNFKPFNDVYGFERGDRAILLFGEQLRTLAMRDGIFAGHLGGDDFFCCITGETHTAARDILTTLMDDFRRMVESLYDAKDREAGGIVTKDRYGTTRLFSMMGVTIGALTLTPDMPATTADEITNLLSQAKSRAKKNGGGLEWSGGR
jgi:diguanylate cyclase (GGDEF)-like protein